MNVEEFVQEAARRKLVASPERLRYRAEEIFAGIPLREAALLEIGAGPGIFCLWAALHGAREVVALEPELEGSTSGSSRQLEELRRLSGLSTITLLRQTIQEYALPERHFDVVLSYNSIEHLDEAAVQKLRTDADAREVYQAIFRKIARGLRPGGRFIVYNVDRTNFWTVAGLPNPFAPSIEWHLHQNAGFWKHVLLRSGFDRVEIGREVKYSLRRLRPLVSNSMFTFFTDGMFRLVAYAG